MSQSGWTSLESPFHQGERVIQERLGAREKMDKFGRRVIREYMPEQHRQFYAQLSYLLVGTVDTSGNPWASILVGETGFLFSPDEYTLQVQSNPLFGDPLNDNLEEGIDIGLLGIELHSRRRNRMNGVVTKLNPRGFTIQVRQSFGNCPKYIQPRQFELLDFDTNTPKPIYPFSKFLEKEKVMISNADTFFIATAYQNPSAGKTSGVDVSHRGGKTGFVKINDEKILTIPDFAGNCHFNTFGNIELNPRAGLLFINFDKGSLLYLTGNAEVIWEGDEIKQYEGAERLLRFSLNHGYRVEGSLPIKYSV
ncbi:pyridoxamine 5'-phosphate oxidase family protein [Cyanobacterium aponinum UTEX 3221]|uniref:pyridoxamine 5'-phosphate oxidase family protein n=1 Tax=Cyanobacterium aponinum TaxID=379064 RepID=UPI002B4BC5ED|nr:pyridoxamine 5'-phosphate oxidase family protein [Cyanobacterium aponinum]WRL38419.1 pyridoxamine 5'-phosphate oxidase family protein [Cyanobacterium aponinum UTEX 3221]